MADKILNSKLFMGSQHNFINFESVLNCEKKLLQGQREMQSLRSEHRRRRVDEPAEHLPRVTDRRRPLPVRHHERRRDCRRPRRR